MRGIATNNSNVLPIYARENQIQYTVRGEWVRERIDRREMRGFMEREGALFPVGTRNGLSRSLIIRRLLLIGRGLLMILPSSDEEGGCRRQTEGEITYRSNLSWFCERVLSLSHRSAMPAPPSGGAGIGSRKNTKQAPTKEPTQPSYKFPMGTRNLNILCS